MNSPVILIVEDDEPLLEAITTKLQQNSFQTVATRSVDQAITFLQTVDHVDAVWLDHYLPGKYGEEFLRYIRSDEKWKQLPVFLITNSISPDVVNRYLKLGIAQYFTKMLTSLDQVVNSIAIYLQGK
jgi:CheY-like chemotaxis protein